jgi:outer membrane protein assembly factor BamB
VDSASGARRWTYDAAAELDSSPVIAGDAVLFGGADGRLTALRLKDGAELWSLEVGEPIASSPAVASGLVLVGCDDGRLYAFGQ